MKKGQIYEGTVEHVSFPNKGVVHTQEGKEVIVRNTLPGQEISFRVDKLRKGKGEGRLLEVIKKAPNELEAAACRHFGICGGCTYQNLSYEDQLSLKASLVKVLLQPVLEKEGTAWEEVFEGIKESPRQNGYRNKMEFSFGDTEKGGPLALGMHKRCSFYDIVNVEHCQIVDEDYRKILACVLEYFTRHEVPFYHRMNHTGYLRHLLVRKGAKTGEILVDLVTTDQTEENFQYGSQSILEGFAQELNQLELSGKIVGILHTINDSVADVIKNEKTFFLYGNDFFHEELLGLKFKITPFTFFQTNSFGAEVLYDLAREFIKEALQKEEQEKQGADVSGEGSVVYDLYSGTGTIAQILAPVAKKVIGVEIVEEAVEAAKENAAQNGLSNCEFIAGDVLKVLDELNGNPDVIVLDPPRDGIHPKALEKIGARIRVNKILYISCKPTSLARDLAALQEYGYRVERICCVDMFPYTANVETVALLTLKTKQ